MAWSRATAAGLGEPPRCHGRARPRDGAALSAERPGPAAGPRRGGAAAGRAGSRRPPHHMRELRANGAAAGAGAPLAPADAHSKRGRARAPAAPYPCPRAPPGPGAAGGDARRGRGLRRPPARRHAGEEPVQPGGRWLRLPRPAAQRGGLPARHPLPGQGETRPRSPSAGLRRGPRSGPPLPRACQSLSLLAGPGGLRRWRPPAGSPRSAGPALPVADRAGRQLSPGDTC